VFFVDSLCIQTRTGVVFPAFLLRKSQLSVLDCRTLVYRANTLTSAASERHDVAEESLVTELAE
jgi:hypothetical protein